MSTNAMIIVVSLFSMFCIIMAYLLGRKDGRYIERRTIMRVLYSVSLEEYSPIKRITIISMLNEIKAQLTKEWEA